MEDMILGNSTVLLAMAALTFGTVAGLVAYVVSTMSSDGVKRIRYDTYINHVSSAKDAGLTPERRAATRRRAIESKVRALQEAKKHSKSRVGAVAAHLKRAGLDIGIAEFWGTCGILGLGSAVIWLQVLHFRPILAIGVFV